MTTTAPTLRSVTVKFRIDDYPEQTANVRYRVFETETEITFPKGDKRIFKNWDVRNVRESFFKEEIMQQHSAEEGASTRSKIELVEHGIRPCDVTRFVASLAQKSRYESLFDLKFEQADDNAPLPAAETKKRAPMRKFPYLEVARLWNEGKTQRQIAAAIGYLDESKDCTHTLRTFLTKMHAGYPDATGQRVKLPYRARKAAAGV
jgi:hypothetical protein